MKSFLRKFTVALSLLSIITIQGDALEKTPPNFQLLGNADGLVHIPGDDLFLFYPNMLPGDKVTRTLEIKNKYDHPYELFIRAERVSPREEFDLLDKINLTITYDNKTIYVGSASGEYEITEDTSLGIFDPGEEATLVATAELDGAATGNEYKNKSAQVDWIFTAIRSEENLDSNDNVDNQEPSSSGNLQQNSSSQNSSSQDYSPQTGDNGVLKYTLLLSGGLILLILIRKKNRFN